MNGYKDYIDRAMSVRSDEQAQPQPYSVVAGNPGERGYLPVMQQLQTGLRQRMQNGPNTSRAPMQMPSNVQLDTGQLRGLFGGINPPVATGDPLTMRTGGYDAPSPGLGSGTPGSVMFEDGSQMYPGKREDPLLQLLTELLNRRFPNN